MAKIIIISSSIRTGRNSHRVAKYFKTILDQDSKNSTEILDLLEYNFPLFDERLKNIKDPLPSAVNFAGKIKNADGILIVTPEYNGGYPASLKNVVDLLYEEWRKKPIAISTVSSGAFGGSQVLTSLQFTMFKIGAILVPAMFPVAEVTKNFTEDGKATDPEKTDARAHKFVSELLSMIKAHKNPEQ